MAFLCDEQPMEPEPLAEDESRDARLAALEKQVAALLRERRDTSAENEVSEASDAISPPSAAVEKEKSVKAKEEWVEARGTVYSLFIAAESDEQIVKGAPWFILLFQYVGVIGTWLAAEDHFANAAEEQLSCALVNGTAVPTCGAALELASLLPGSDGLGPSKAFNELSGYEVLVILFIELFLIAWVLADLQLGAFIFKIGKERGDRSNVV